MRFVGLLMLGAAGYLLFWPVEITPQAWTPMAAPALEGALAPNEKLMQAQRAARDAGEGGEAVVLDAAGQVYTGFVDGRIVRLNPETGAVSEVVNTQGRPLGMKFAPDGRLIIADAVKGLLAWDGQTLEVLLTAVDGVPLGFPDDLDISSAGVVYLSDASVKFGVHKVMQDVYSHEPNGRLVSFDLNTGAARNLLSGLWFANGVALAADESFVLINETTRYRVRRLWLSGPQAGTDDLFAENLPGFPDNVTRNPRGGFWVALYGPRSAELDRLLPQPFLRKVVWRLPRSLQPLPPKIAHVLEFNADGEVTRTLMGTRAEVFAPVTSAVEREGVLWLGSLSAAGLAHYEL